MGALMGIQGLDLMLKTHAQSQIYQLTSAFFHDSSNLALK